MRSYVVFHDDDDDDNGHILALLSLALMAAYLAWLFFNLFLYLFQMHTLQLFIFIFFKIQSCIYNWSDCKYSPLPISTSLPNDFAGPLMLVHSPPTVSTLAKQLDLACGKWEHRILYGLYCASPFACLYLCHIHEKKSL